MPLIFTNAKAKPVIRMGMSNTVTAPATYDFLGELGKTSVNILGSVVPSMFTTSSQLSLMEQQQKLASVQAQNSQIIAEMEARTQSAQLASLQIQSQTEKAKQLSQIVTIALIGTAVIGGAYLFLKKKKR